MYFTELKTYASLETAAHPQPPTLVRPGPMAYQIYCVKPTGLTQTSWARLGPSKSSGESGKIAHMYSYARVFTVWDGHLFHCVKESCVPRDVRAGHSPNRRSSPGPDGLVSKRQMRSHAHSGRRRSVWESLHSLYWSCLSL